MLHPFFKIAKSCQTQEESNESMAISIFFFIGLKLVSKMDIPNVMKEMSMRVLTECAEVFHLFLQSILKEAF